MPEVNGTVTLVAPPPGYIVDFENPQRQLQTQVYIVFVVENLFAFIFLLQRLYTKIRLMKLFQIEDGTAPTFQTITSLTRTSHRRCSLGILDRDAIHASRRLALRRHRRARVGDFLRRLRSLLAPDPGGTTRLCAVHSVCQSGIVSILRALEPGLRVPVLHLAHHVRHCRVVHGHLLQSDFRVPAHCRELGSDLAGARCMC